MKQNLKWNTEVYGNTNTDCLSFFGDYDFYFWSRAGARKINERKTLEHIDSVPWLVAVAGSKVIYGLQFVKDRIDRGRKISVMSNTPVIQFVWAE